MELNQKSEELDNEKLVCEDLEVQLQQIMMKVQNDRQATNEIRMVREDLEALRGLAEEGNEYVNLQRSEEKLVLQRKQHKMELEAADELFEKAKQDLLLVEKDRREAMVRIDKAKARVCALEEQIVKDREKTDREIEKMVEEYKVTEAKFWERDRKRMEAAGILTP